MSFFVIVCGSPLFLALTLLLLSMNLAGSLWRFFKLCTRPYSLYFSLLSARHFLMYSRASAGVRFGFCVFLVSIRFQNQIVE